MARIPATLSEEAGSMGVALSSTAGLGCAWGAGAGAGRLTPANWACSLGSRTGGGVREGRAVLWPVSPQL